MIVNKICIVLQLLSICHITIKSRLNLTKFRCYIFKNMMFALVVSSVLLVIGICIENKSYVHTVYFVPCNVFFFGSRQRYLRVSGLLPNHTVKMKVVNMNLILTNKNVMLVSPPPQHSHTLFLFSSFFGPKNITSKNVQISLKVDWYIKFQLLIVL